MLTMVGVKLCILPCARCPSRTATLIHGWVHQAAKDLRHDGCVLAAVHLEPSEQSFALCLLQATITSLKTNSKYHQKGTLHSACPLLDLPIVVLESILRRLSPYHLCQLAQASKDLRKRCRSDEIWEPLYNERWGKIAGMNAFDLGRCLLFQRDSWILESKLIKAVPVIRPNEAFVNLYWQLECGEFWFPGQVFNHQGHAGFESCYDAVLEYDRNSDTFCARYLPHSASNIENGISWERIRKPPVMTSPSELYIPDVLDELRPGDHIEVQWRMNRNYPYEWWYGIVGHADNCRSENQNCSCHLDEMFWIEFRQYPVGSRWRRFQMRRNRATEVGSVSDGFYGGIRKLTNMEDISAWLQPSLEYDGLWSIYGRFFTFDDI